MAAEIDLWLDGAAFAEGQHSGYRRDAVEIDVLGDLRT